MYPEFLDADVIPPVLVRLTNPVNPIFPTLTLPVRMNPCILSATSLILCQAYAPAEFVVNIWLVVPFPKVLIYYIFTGNSSVMVYH